MNLKTLPLLALSFVVLSGCTNSCQGEQKSASESAVTAPDVEASASDQAGAADSAPVEEAAVDVQDE